MRFILKGSILLNFMIDDTYIPTLWRLKKQPRDRRQDPQCETKHYDRKNLCILKYFLLYTHETQDAACAFMRICLLRYSIAFRTI